MDEKQNTWGKITKITKEYQPKDDLASEAITKINQRESTFTFKKIIPLWFIIALCFVMIVAIILVSVLFKTNSDPLYLSDAALEITEIDDLDKLVEENNLNIFYIKAENCYNKCARIKADGRIAYIEQSFLYISSAGFEQINIKIVLIDATYKFSERFTVMDKSETFSGIKVDYTIYQNVSSNLYALFKQNIASYYLEIPNITGNEGTLKGVVEILTHN